jgi:hypothetical protein
MELEGSLPRLEGPAMSYLGQAESTSNLPSFFFKIRFDVISIFVFTALSSL